VETCGGGGPLHHGDRPSTMVGFLLPFLHQFDTDNQQTSDVIITITASTNGVVRRAAVGRSVAKRRSAALIRRRIRRRINQLDRTCPGEC
jgi:hypothetical protein